VMAAGFRSVIHKLSVMRYVQGIVRDQNECDLLLNELCFPFAEYAVRTIYYAQAASRRLFTTEARVRSRGIP
jgi:hypothetical protein